MAMPMFHENILNCVGENIIKVASFGVKQFSEENVIMVPELHETLEVYLFLFQHRVILYFLLKFLTNFTNPH